MGFSRFAQVSPFKNIQANVAKKEEWFSELPLASSSALDGSDALKATDSCAVARGAGVGSLVFLPFSKPGKQAQKAATWNASGRPITDFDTSFLEPLIAAASEDGRINIASRPSEDDLVSTSSSSLSLASIASLSAPAQKVVESVQFHPTSAGLLLSNQGAAVQIWDTSSSAQAIYTVNGPAKGHWSVSWSHDGRLVQTAAKDNTINLWDIRQSTDKAAVSTAAHQGFNKAMRITAVAEQIFTTGFSKTRDRECALWDPRNFDKPLAKQIIDTNTGVLMPLVDHARKIVYLVGRSDMSMRWAELTGASDLTFGSSPLPVPSQGAALLPQTSSTLNVMQAEVQRLVLLGQDAIVPVSMRVPRRNYLDFYGELFPPVQEYQTSVQGAQEWREGNDPAPVLISPQPGKSWGGAGEKQPATSKAQSSGSRTEEPVAGEKPTSQAAFTSVQAPAEDAGKAPVPAPATAEAPVAQMDSMKLINRETPAARPSVEDDKQSAPAPVTASQDRPAPSAAVKATVSTQSESKPQTTGPVASTSNSNTHWSRAYLAGKTALKPDYEDVHNINSTTSASVRLLQAHQQYFFYPLSGPGGRIAYHATSAKGRLPVHLPSLASGHDVVDFALDPFDTSKVCVANNDGRIRVFQVPAGEESGEQTQVNAVLEDSMDKMTELVPHPALANILLSASEDHGESTLRIWNTETKSVLAKTAVGCKGIHSVAWDHLGNRIAVAGKDKKLRILDPRGQTDDKTVIGSSHESVRPCKVVWLDDNHLITCGFSRSAFREILLHRISADGANLEIVAKTSLDVSPAPLFPHYDEDTNILFVYAKGERTCHAYEVTNLQGSATPALSKLPSFEHGSLQLSFAFLPKQTVDVKAVEVAHAYRLTSNAVQHVKFSIPRAKVDFFQDDVYAGGATRDTTSPDGTLSVDEWMQGKSASSKNVNLRPEGMPLLSEAPAAAPRLKQQVMAKQLSEEESQQAYLDSLFKNKQAEVDSDEDDDRVKRRDRFDDDEDW